MQSVTHDTHSILDLFAQGPLGKIQRGIQNQIHQRWVSYGLRRDVSIPFTAPPAKIPIRVRLLRDEDIPALFPLDDTLPRQELLEVKNRRAHLRAGIPTCFVAEDLTTGRPCYAQWLMTSFSNERIQSFFKGRFPLLEADEALLENAYTPPAYRGKGVMSSAMARIAELATDRGVRHVMTFIHQDNVPSLKGCAKAGFRPYLMRKDDHACFHLIRRRSFEQLPRGFELPM